MNSRKLRTTLLAAFVAATFSGTKAHAQKSAPNGTVVQSEISHPSYFSFLLGGIAPKGDRQHKLTKSDNGDIYEWSNSNQSVVAQFGPAADIKGDVWRLSEMEYTYDPERKKSELVGITTSFYRHGVRSKTRCSGASEETAECVTASRKFCETFKARNKPLGIQITDEGTRENILRMGRECSAYADYLNQTLDPAKLLNGTERSERDQNVVKSDLAALRDLKTAATAKSVNGFNLKGMNDWFGAEDKVGASTTGMKNRADRLKQAGSDFRALSHLAAMCSETTFVEQSRGAGWTLPADGTRTKDSSVVR